MGTYLAQPRYEHARNTRSPSYGHSNSTLYLGSFSSSSSKASSSDDNDEECDDTEDDGVGGGGSELIEKSDIFFFLSLWLYF